jgi:anthranilate synthase component 1
MYLRHRLNSSSLVVLLQQWAGSEGEQVSQQDVAEQLSLWVDAVDAILPAGTLSGAPKLRACEIINELEDNKRGIYGGAIGYISFTGNLDTCIAIRLAFSKNGKVFVRSGAGIVADSVPEKEYRECIQKAAAVKQALWKAQEGMEA